MLSLVVEYLALKCLWSGVGVRVGGYRLDVEEPGKGGMGGMSFGLVVCTRKEPFLVSCPLSLGISNPGRGSPFLVRRCQMPKHLLILHPLCSVEVIILRNIYDYSKESVLLLASSPI